MSKRSDRTRQALEAAHGLVWTEQELSDEFEIKAFIVPTQVVVVRKVDGVVGSMTCENSFYFDFTPDPGFGEAY